MPASYNRCILIGNLTRQPDVKYLPSGSAVCEIGLAVNRDWFDKTTNQKKSETTFVDITFFGKVCEVLGEYTNKGSAILVEGRLSMDAWDDKTTGQKRTKLKVIGESMQLLGQPRKDPPPQQPPQQEPAYEAPKHGDPTPDDEVPF